MSVDELHVARADNHISSCSECSSFLGDMLSLSNGLEAMVIPHPVGMMPPAGHKVRRDRVMSLLAATLALLVFGALAAVVFRNYFVADMPHGPGTRESIFYNDRRLKTAEPQPNAR